MTWLVNGLKDSLIYWKANGAATYNKITDHNRSPLSVSIDRIENAQRTANGTLRKSIIAEKHQFNLSWSNVPNLAAYTVDNGWAGSDMYDFYMDNRQPFYLKITQKFDPDAVNNYQEFLVYFASCSFEVIKRNPSAATPYMLMDVSITLEEV
jgi:hypothetical protein